MNKWQMKFVNHKLKPGDYIVSLAGEITVNTYIERNNYYWWSKGTPEYVIKPLVYKSINWWKIAFWVLLISSVAPFLFYQGSDELGCLYFEFFGKLFIFGVLE